MLKLNKTIRYQIAVAATKSKFLPLFEAAEKALVKAAHNHFVENSLHSDVMKLSKELLPFIQSTNHFRLYNSLRLTDVSFNILRGTGSQYLKYYQFNNPVFACDIHNVPEKFPEEIALIKVVKETDSFFKDVKSVLDTYTKAEKMFEDLPWTKEFYPYQTAFTGTMLVDIQTVEKINALMAAK